MEALIGILPLPSSLIDGDHVKIGLFGIDFLDWGIDLVDWD